jgi:hypothetical protein
VQDSPIALVNELCFDLSRFNSKVYRLSHFVRSLIDHRENADLLSYESTLRYVEFPALDLKIDDRETYGDGVHVEHAEVFKILDWLGAETNKGGKGVNEIIELTVPDRLVNPHKETRIGKYAEKFKVEVLDWRFLDMSISVFGKATKERIRELHLYASGKLAVIRHWLSEEGLATLPNLTELEIRVVQELMTKRDCETTTESIRKEFKTFKETVNEERDRKGHKHLKVNVEHQLWNPTIKRLADLEEM